MCVADTELSGEAVTAGKRVLLGLASANRDENTWETPEEFSLERTENPHLAFGLGIHMCIGASLARMEARVGLNALLDQFVDLALAPGYEYQRVEPVMMRGPRRLDVTFEPVGPR